MNSSFKGASRLTSPRPLNPVLHDRLMEAFGRVSVKNVGQRNNLQVGPDPLIPGRTRRKLIAEGETYWVNCFRCGDSRSRLCINHAWGSDANAYFFVHCFNEECQSEEGFFSELEYRLLPFGGGRTTVLPAAGPAKVAQRRVVTAPGPCIALRELSPSHPGHMFLHNRGHDPIKLGEQFGVSYCVQSKLPQADKRIIIPAAMDGRLAGWQARYVDQAGDGDVTGLSLCPTCRKPFRPRPPSKICPVCGETGEKIAKYWSAPGFKKSETLLNYDRAKAFNFVVLMEGPMDVFRLGHPQLGQDMPGPGVAVFGHGVSPVQQRLLFDTWRHGTVFVMFDPDAVENAEMLANELHGQFGGGVHLLTTPGGRDPGDCPHELLWRIIRQKAQNTDTRLIGPGIDASS